MAELMPSSLQEFSALRGVGEWKIEKYGDGFLNVLKQAWTPFDTAEFFRVIKTFNPITANRSQNFRFRIPSPESLSGCIDSNNQVANVTCWSNNHDIALNLRLLSSAVCLRSSIFGK